MKYHTNFILLFLIGILFSSCSRTQLLVSTFENDITGIQPNTELPGDPVGDVIRYDNVIAPRIRVQNSTISGEKALHFTQVPLIPYPPETRVWLNFRGASTSSDKKLRFSWTAQHQNAVDPDEYVLIELSDGAAKTIARFYFYADGTIKRVEDIDSDRKRDLGKVDPTLRHVVFVEVDVRAKTYKLDVITAATNSNISRDALPFNYSDFTVNSTNPINPTLSFRLDNGGNDRRKYIIEGVEISQEN
ncbi:hypothetical protein [Larkinella terrae]|uniref:Uncharacterized protein n=2 Tax=Larkinella terrae TaxID=2025311 RepID=A0A7K0EVP8_9BACT|nr:hypothetical protein [Larkinella terrae]